jgi:hypothetical protein
VKLKHFYKKQFLKYHPPFPEQNNGAFFDTLTETSFLPGWNNQPACLVGFKMTA